ncbi:hypothetical protein M2401_000803 [Pseudomonas sp. JUb42]|uniref:hypothetical protein n=1 Tax=Pseudomonas sp. JUb42 TaxID=2940611 RepID=UPI002168358E|nr:hypothetical protein [Pseudomonas sp. JUb42]MCS3467082.1 hypothetical protein [Pseudomonas sp. JUb42]
MQILKTGLIVILSAYLVGCAHRQKTPDMPLSEVRPTPVCEGEKQCSEMWGRALDAVSTVTRMKVASANDTFIQTYPTRQIGYLNGQVYKQSLGGGKYAIQGKFDCGRYDWCDNLLNSAQNLFNTSVQGFDPVK